MSDYICEFRDDVRWIGSFKVGLPVHGWVLLWVIKYILGMAPIRWRRAIVLSISLRVGPASISVFISGHSQFRVVPIDYIAIGSLDLFLQLINLILHLLILILQELIPMPQLDLIVHRYILILNCSQSHRHGSLCEEQGGVGLIII